MGASRSCIPPPTRGQRPGAPAATKTFGRVFFFPRSFCARMHSTVVSAEAVRIHTHVGNCHLKINHRTFRKTQPLSRDTIRGPHWDNSWAKGHGTEQLEELQCKTLPLLLWEWLQVGTEHPMAHGAPQGTWSTPECEEPRRKSKAQPCSPSLTLAAHMWPRGPAGSTKPKAGAAPCSTPAHRHLAAHLQPAPSMQEG